MINSSLGRSLRVSVRFRTDLDRDLRGARGSVTDVLALAKHLRVPVE